MFLYARSSNRLMKSQIMLFSTLESFYLWKLTEVVSILQRHRSALEANSNLINFNVQDHIDSYYDGVDIRQPITLSRFLEISYVHFNPIYTMHVNNQPVVTPDSINGDLYFNAKNLKRNMILWLQNHPEYNSLI